MITNYKKLLKGDDPAYWQRKEWVDWILDLAYELELEASADYSGV